MAQEGHGTLTATSKLTTWLFVFQGADAKTVNYLGHHKEAELISEAKSRPSTPSHAGPPARSVAWLTSHHRLGRATDARLGSQLHNPIPETVREAGFCLGTSATALESKGVSDPFFQSRRSLWSPARARQGSFHRKVIWSGGKLLIRPDPAANCTSTPYRAWEPKPSEKDNKCCT